MTHDSHIFIGHIHTRNVIYMYICAEITEIIGKVFCSLHKIRSISVILTVLNIKIVKRVKA